MIALANRKAGEVTVNTLEVMSRFEIVSIQVLRHANNLFEKETDLSDLPTNIKDLFTNQFSRNLISDLIFFFANTLKFSPENQENEVKILGSLLIKPEHLDALSKKAKSVTFLIEDSLNKTLPKLKITQTFWNNHLN